MFFGPGHPFFGPVHVFWTRPTVFHPGAQEMWGTCLCVFWTLWRFFFRPACICAGPREFYLDIQINCFWPRFLFLDPCNCFVDLASIGRGRGEFHCFTHSPWAGCFWIWRLIFLNLYVFLDLAQDGRNLDIETRCMQEAADAGKVRILKQQKRKKWWRGQWGKSTSEAKWMQEIERHIGRKGKFDVETGWAQQVVERWGVKPIHWN